MELSCGVKQQQRVVYFENSSLCKFGSSLWNEHFERQGRGPLKLLMSFTKSMQAIYQFHFGKVSDTRMENKPRKKV